MSLRKVCVLYQAFPLLSEIDCVQIASTLRASPSGVSTSNSNHIGGSYNRLEASRKYLFGSMGILGESNSLVIGGVLILRGPDYKPVVDVAPDWESHKPIDLADPAQRSFLEAALAWDLERNGSIGRM